VIGYLCTSTRRPCFQISCKRNEFFSILPNISTFLRLMPAHDVDSASASPWSHYDILGVSQDLVNKQKDPLPLLRQAYHRALLRHHPDKTIARKLEADQHHGSDPSPQVTIDQIAKAFTVLASRKGRAQYDEELRLTQGSRQDAWLGSASSTGASATGFQTGMEIVDLDDLDYDETEESWYRACRCGNARGYSISTDDLEQEAEYGELLVECKDCSLWLKVQFALDAAECGEVNRSDIGAGEKLGLALTSEDP
jgi:curved DNA-binding protein CbpA